MRRQTLWLASIMIAAITIVFIVCGGISAKEYKLPEVYIEAHITSDGSIIVSEQRTYLFSGSFSWASMWFPNRGEQVIEIVSVAEGGQRYSANASETPGHIKYHLQRRKPASSGSLALRIKNAPS